MAQRLIVEGNDAIVIADLMKKRRLPPPKGYTDKIKFKNEFTKSAGSIDKVKTVLIEEINSPNVQRVGIVVDANEIGVEGRIQMLGDILEKNGLEKIPDNWPTWKSTNAADNLQISIWVMPDNKSHGYLEHFLFNLIPKNLGYAKDYASELIDNFYLQHPKGISEVRKQKAKTHAYLALMKSPGLPFGTAVQSNYFDTTHPSVNALENWFKHTFILEE